MLWNRTCSCPAVSLFDTRHDCLEKSSRSIRLVNLPLGLSQHILIPTCMCLGSAMSCRVPPPSCDHHPLRGKGTLPPGRQDQSAHADWVGGSLHLKRVSHCISRLVRGLRHERPGCASGGNFGRNGRDKAFFRVAESVEVRLKRGQV